MLDCFQWAWIIFAQLWKVSILVELHALTLSICTSHFSTCSLMSCHSSWLLALLIFSVCLHLLLLLPPPSWPYMMLVAKMVVLASVVSSWCLCVLCYSITGNFVSGSHLQELRRIFATELWQHYLISLFLFYFAAGEASCSASCSCFGPQNNCCSGMWFWWFFIFQLSYAYNSIL